MSSVGPGQVKIFLSYCRKDESLLRELEGHLAALKREGRVATWKDRMLEAGSEWEPELRHHLETAQVILLLVSSDFLASEFCWSVELKEALERHHAGTAKVIPIILRHCDWQNTPIAKLQALPKDGRPAKSWPDLDEAFLNVVQGLRTALASPAPKVVSPPRAAPPKPPLPAPAPTPPKAPTLPPKGATLRLELGVHTAPIRRIAVDAAERFLVTGSDDKTLRIWDLNDGELLRVLRPNLGPGNEGKVYAVAISPEGSLVAAGGFTTTGNEENIYLFDRGTGKLIRRIDGLPGVALNLVFSADGSRLAATFSGTGGVWVLASWNGSKLFSDTAGDNCQGAAYAIDGRLAATSYDGFLRLYSTEHHLLAKVKAPGGARPFGICFSPSSQELAVVYDDSTQVDVVSGQNLEWLFSADNRGTNSSLSKAAWSADGQKLFAAGRYNLNGRYPIRSWPNAGRGPALDLPGPASTVMDLHPLRNGRLVYGAADPAWAVLSTNVLLERTAAQADFSGLLSGLRTSASGREIAFAFERGSKEALFTLPGRRLELVPPPAKLDHPRTEAPGLEIADWEDTTQPRRNGQELQLEAYEMSRCLAIAADGQSFLLGTGWWLRLFRRDGEPVWKKPVPGTAWAVNLSRDGRLALAAFGDGTIRWFRVSDGEELLAFFPHIDTKRWILWTPSGYYDASPGGEKMIGWHVNRGQDLAADFYPVSKFRDHFHRPEVIDRILDTLDEAEAVRLAE